VLALARFGLGQLLDQLVQIADECFQSSPDARDALFCQARGGLDALVQALGLGLELAERFALFIFGILGVEDRVEALAQLADRAVFVEDGAA
jgi:hypothetical protein